VSARADARTAAGRFAAAGAGRFRPVICGRPHAAALALLASALLLLLLPGGAGARRAAVAPITGWLTFGNGAGRPGSTAAGLDDRALRPAWFHTERGTVTAQPLVARNVPAAGQTTVFVASSTGRVEALAPNGYVRWRRHFGTLAHSCRQLRGYGITGTPVVDPATRALYVADAFGLLHGLDLVTGAERPGWPVRLYDDPERELVWGALLLAGGSVYAGTGAYCDRPMEGKLVRVELASRAVTSWTAVPPRLGGGGGIWGWGGIAYSAARDSLYVVTGNAFEGGENVGEAFRENAGHGEQLVELTRDLEVVAASHPEGFEQIEDADFVGSPVLFSPAGCGELVAALNKNGTLYVWRADAVAAGPVAALALQQADARQPVLTQPAWSPALRSLYAVTWSQLVRVAVGADCVPRLGFRRDLGRSTLHGSPTVAGGAVWLAVPGTPGRLASYDAATGAPRSTRELGGVSFAPPTIVDGRLFEDSRHAYATPTAAGSKPTARASSIAAHTSWADARRGWQSRETGVWATEDGGRTWRRIHAAPAERVVRTSAAAGLISVGASPTACNCRTRQLWTRDGGRTWRPAGNVGPFFAGRGARMVAWRDRTVLRVAWPPAGTGPLRLEPLASFDERVADAKPLPDGTVAVLLSAAGEGWDDAPRVAIAGRGDPTVVDLPEAGPRTIAYALEVDWPRVRVVAARFGDEAAPAVWESRDGGVSWTGGSMRAAAARAGR
jgi:hypothetical protein